MAYLEAQNFLVEATRIGNVVNGVVRYAEPLGEPLTVGLVARVPDWLVPDLAEHHAVEGLVGIVDAAVARGVLLGVVRWGTL